MEFMKLLMVTALLIELCWNMKMTIKITLLTKGVRYGVCCFAPRQQCFEWQLVGQLSNAEYTNCYIVHCISLHVLNVWMFWMTTHGPSLRRLVHAEYVNCDTVQCLALQCLQPISFGLQRTQTAILCNVFHSMLIECLHVWTFWMQYLVTHFTRLATESRLWVHHDNMLTCKV